MTSTEIVRLLQEGLLVDEPCHLHHRSTIKMSSQIVSKEDQADKVTTGDRKIAEVLLNERIVPLHCPARKMMTAEIVWQKESVSLMLILHTRHRRNRTENVKLEMMMCSNGSMRVRRVVGVRSIHHHAPQGMKCHTETKTIYVTGYVDNRLRRRQPTRQASLFHKNMLL